MQVTTVYTTWVTFCALKFICNWPILGFDAGRRWWWNSCAPDSTCFWVGTYACNAHWIMARVVESNNSYDRVNARSIARMLQMDICACNAWLVDANKKVNTAYSSCITIMPINLSMPLRISNHWTVKDIPITYWIALWYIGAGNCRATQCKKG